jgi:hypothetical protein
MTTSLQDAERSGELVCWQCGASFAALSLPLQRLDECRQCHAELHVCKLCRFYDVTVAKHCREPIAEEVRDKQRANYCDYFTPQPQAWSNAGLTAAAKAKAELDSLFGGISSAAPTPSAADKARADLDALFGKK